MLIPRCSPTRLRRRAGFTLVELLTVIAIIGILAGILIPTVSFAIKSARSAKSKVQLANLVSMCEMYHQEYKYWPTFSIQVSASKDTVFRLRENAPRFVRIMTGKPDTGDAQYNKRSIPFASFKDTDLTSDPNSVTPVDAFLNDDLFLIYNTNISDVGHIQPDTINGISMECVRTNRQIQVKQNPSIPVNADCIALSPGEGGSNADAITTWTIVAPDE